MPPSLFRHLGFVLFRKKWLGNFVLPPFLFLIEMIALLYNSRVLDMRGNSFD